jgi:hypothetical protein
MRNSYKIVGETPEGRTSLVRPRGIWEDNIKIDLKEIGCECVNCIRVMSVAVSSKHGNEIMKSSLNSLATFVFSRSTLHHGAGYEFFSQSV